VTTIDEKTKALDAKARELGLDEFIDSYPEPLARVVLPEEHGRRNPNAIELHNLLEQAGDYNLGDLVELIDPKIDELAAIVRSALRWTEAR
jgi:hypothetical protein